MTLPIVQIKLDPDVKYPPQYAHLDDSGADLCANEDIDIWPGDYYPVKTGIHLWLLNGYEGQIRSRSGLAAKYGVHVLNSPGTIDQGYTGELFVILINHGQDKFHVRKGDRIAQLVIAPYTQVIFQEVNIISESERGENGLGSTGIC